MTFDPRSVRAFRFVSHRFDETTATASLVYAFDDGPEMTEAITFSGADLPLDESRRRALDRCLHHLHLVAGVSYYKAAVPPEIRVESRSLSRPTARFLDKLYLHGLGEFAYRNALDLRRRIRFPWVDEAVPEPAPVALPRRTAVPVGGGKDSVVTMEALAAAGEPMVLFLVGDPPPIRQVAEVSGLPRIVVRRRLSPRLLELNQAGAYNGHVPISAIIAFILAASAVLYGFDAAALSNERSANTGNLVWGDLEVNHQYSKSLEFERDLAVQLRHEVLPGFRYFSFLRPLSEIAIAGLFSRHRRYHQVFRSCNTAFRLHPDERREGWCLNCPKCRFVYLALAIFSSREDMGRIFGGEMLDDAAQEEGFKALLGLAEHRPFECVGEIEECVAAWRWLMAAPEWRDALLVRRLGPLLPAGGAPREALRRLLEPVSEHLIPERFLTLLPAAALPVSLEV